MRLTDSANKKSTCFLQAQWLFLPRSAVERRTGYEQQFGSKSLPVHGLFLLFPSPLHPVPDDEEADQVRGEGDRPGDRIGHIQGLRYMIAALPEQRKDEDQTKSADPDD